MMAMLWAQEIMNGRKTYEQVPRLLKAEVRRILIESGLDDPEQPEEEIETISIHTFLAEGDCKNIYNYFFIMHIFMHYILSYL